MFNDLTDNIIHTLKEIALERFTKEIMVYAVSQIPFLGVPIVSQAVTLLVRIIIKIAIDKTSLGVNLVQVWAINKKEVHDAIKSKEVLNEKIKNKQDTTEAEKKFNDAADNLIKLRTATRV